MRSTEKGLVCSCSSCLYDPFGFKRLLIFLNRFEELREITLSKTSTPALLVRLSFLILHHTPYPLNYLNKYCWPAHSEKSIKPLIKLKHDISTHSISRRQINVTIKFGQWYILTSFHSRCCTFQKCLRVFLKKRKRVPIMGRLLKSSEKWCYHISFLTGLMFFATAKSYHQPLTHESLFNFPRNQPLVKL